MLLERVDRFMDEGYSEFAPYQFTIFQSNHTVSYPQVALTAIWPIPIDPI